MEHAGEVEDGRGCYYRPVAWGTLLLLELTNG